jgi:di/tricarboxylate transporter
LLLEEEGESRLARFAHYEAANAIASGSGYVSIPRMAKTGVALDLAATVLVACWCWVVMRGDVK